MADTPLNNQLIEYRLDELMKLSNEILTKMDDSQKVFNEHVTQDAIVAEKLAALIEEKKSNGGLWAGIGGAAAGAGSFLYALMSGGK